MKSRWNFLFLIFCLVLLTGLLFSYSEMREYFSPVRDYQEKLTQAREEIERQKLRVAILHNEFFDFQQQVAKVLPEKVPTGNERSSFQLRKLASVSKAHDVALDSSGVYLERAKALFREQNYRAAVQEFEAMVRDFGASPSAVEAHFFLAESLFLLGEYQTCLDVIEKMMSHYPESELTGFIMLRQGQILASRNRVSEAREVFSMVRRSFASYADLSRQAETLSQAVK
ncbi:MAG: tetratricopeptide repeat protein [Proteobacteria bacterium]|jgi:TolA-binding protein|nr:tetratricopeptide repeat protein [Pseudomonadota bacterium]